MVMPYGRSGAGAVELTDLAGALDRAREPAVDHARVVALAAGFPCRLVFSLT
jgi:hypothetical protein